MLHITHDFTISPLMKTLATSHKHQTLIGIHIHLTFRFSKFWKEKWKKNWINKRFKNMCIKHIPRTQKKIVYKNVVCICGKFLPLWQWISSKPQNKFSPCKKYFCSFSYFIFFCCCFCNEHYKTSWKWQFYVQVMQRVVVFDMYTSIMQFTHDQESSIVTIYYKTWSPFINYVNTWKHNHFEQVIFKAFIKAWSLFSKEIVCHVNSTLPSLYSNYHAKPMFKVQ